MKKINNQSGFAHIGLVLLFVLVLAVAGGAGYYVYSQNKTDDVASEASVSQKTTTDEADEVQSSDLTKQELVSLIQKKIEDANNGQYTSVEANDKAQLFIAHEDQDITTFSVSGVTVKFEGKASGEGRSGTAWDSISQMQSIDRAFSEVAKEAGLNLNKVNSYDFYKKVRQTDPTKTYVNYSGYSNDKFVCVVGIPDATFDLSISQDADFSLDIGCVDVEEYDSEYALQVELDKALNLGLLQTSSYDPADQSFVSISKRSDEFIYGGGGVFEGGGGYALWKNVDGKWKYVVGGQSIAPCSAVDNQGIPEGFLPSKECGDSETNKIRPIIN